MFYTSGTTGIPKGVVFSHAAMMSRVRCDAGAMRFAEDDVMLFVLPFFHITCVSAFVVLHVGATMVVSASSKASSVVELIERHRVTRVGLVPFHLRAMAAHLEREGGALDSLKLVIYGAEPIEEGLLDRCKRLLGCDFLQGYGMTETASSVTLLLPEHHGDPRLRKTVGKPAPGMQVKVVDERGDACAAGVPGDVLVRTDTLMLGYWRDEERTGSAVRDGWYHTEDVGFLDENGFLTLVDRKKNLIITGGENVYPQEVCRCILELSDDVEDAVVCGVPDERWGESIAAFIVRRAGSPVTECDIVDHCAARLGRMKKPRYVAFTDNLDRSASGKVPRARIDELVGLLRATSR